MTSADTTNTNVVLDKKAKRNILIAMCVSLMAVIASVSTLNVAQQELAIDFNAPQGKVLWIINIYTLVLAAFLLPIGAVGDRWGRKPVLMTGLSLFAASSALAAIANSAELMIGARALSGLAAAMIMPVTLSVITSSFPEEERGQAIGIWAGVAGGGGMIGMFVAALMVDTATWRWAFILPIALVSIGFALSSKFVPNSKEKTEHRFDIGGSILSLIAIGGIVLGFHEGPENGWTNPLALGGLIIGFVSLALFAIWELKQDSPLLDVRTFKNRGLSTGSLTIMLIFAVMFGIFLVLFPFLQAVLGYSALKSASAILPMAVMMMPMSTVAPKIAKKIGSKKTIMTGLAITTAGLVTLALNASVEGGYLSVLPGLMILGLGMGLTMTPSTEAITESLPQDKQGVASALNDTTREIGGAIGVALLGAIVTSTYKGNIEAKLGGVPKEIASQASEGIGNAYGVVESAGKTLAPQQAGQIIDAAKQAFVDGWVQAMWVGACILAFAFFYVAILGPRKKDDVLDLDIEKDALVESESMETL